MTCIARVASVDGMRDGITVVVGYRGSLEQGTQARVVTKLSAATDTSFTGTEWELVDPVDVTPALFIPDDVARALLDELSRHYGGTGDTRVLRRDYDAERARVDLLIGALIEGPPTS